MPPTNAPASKAGREAIDTDFRDPRRQGPWITAFRLLLFPLIYAVPFALFFGTIWGTGVAAASGKTMAANTARNLGTLRVIIYLQSG